MPSTNGHASLRLTAPEERVLDISANLIASLLRERETIRRKARHAKAMRTALVFGVGLAAIALAYGTVSVAVRNYEVKSLQRSIGSRSLADAKRAGDIERVYDFEVNRSREAVHEMNCALVAAPPTVALSRVVVANEDALNTVSITGDAESIGDVDLYARLLREEGAQPLVTSVIPNGLLGPKGVAFQIELKGKGPWKR